MENIQTASDKTAHGIYPNVYLPEPLYADFFGGHPSHRTVSIVEHEKKHVERQAELGWLRWLLFYIFSSDFRLNEELVAIEVEMATLKAAGETMNTEYKAQMLSSWLYWKCVTFERARSLLEEMWSRT